MDLLARPMDFMAIVDNCLLHDCRHINLLLVVGFLLAAGLATTVYLRKRRRTVYLLDYACSEGIANCRVPVATVAEHVHQDQLLDSHGVSFMTRILESSGIGDEASVPPGHCYFPPHSSFQEQRSEVEQVLFSAIDDVLAKTGVAPASIDVLVVNCSVFAPVPSISDMIVNRYRLRDDVRDVNLSGMGCSAGVISVDLAAGMLQAAAASGAAAGHALVVSTEIITSNIYNVLFRSGQRFGGGWARSGKKRARQLSDVLFRVGGAAALLSTSDQGMARFRLSHLVRTSTSGTHDGSYPCVFQEEDDAGILGDNLSKDLLDVAGEALKANITALAPLVLPLSEKLRFAMSLAASKLRLLVRNGQRRAVHHIPDFGTAFDHFCVHCGGRAFIDKVQRSLGLSDEQVEASRMTLRRFGNMSSSTVWYELAYIEAKGRMRRRDRAWMIGFESGFMCYSAVWECIRPAEEPDRAWAGCIHRYPNK